MHRAKRTEIIFVSLLALLKDEVEASLENQC